MLAGFLPGNGAAAAFFCSCSCRSVSEVAAREDLAGTRALVFSQPGVPTSAVLWKTAASALFLLLLGAPLVIRCAARLARARARDARGILFVAAAVARAWALSPRAASSFPALYLALWYMAASNAPGADFTGTLSESPRLAVSLLFLAGAAVLVAAAAGRERALRTG